jgi:cobalamin-dependent methionine synthase I
MIDWDVVKKELFRAEGIDKIKDPAQRRIISSCADQCIDAARKLARPKSASVIRQPASLKTVSLGKKINSYIKGSEKVCIFLVTIGTALEDEATRLMGFGDSLKGYLLDRVGSFAVDNFADNFENDLRKKSAAKQKSVSSRFSPGYCEWPVDDQKKLSKIVGFSKAGVRLTKSLMMVPKKSISGIIGIGPEGLFSKKMSQCSICDKKDCNYRRGAKR